MGTLVVSNVSKAYKRYPGKWARAREWLFGTPCHESTWILRDINFRVEPGEAVGIVGVNGAGKSTLLKIITGTTQPTTGNVSIRGRVAALLELGMGFHPDFTGRQNILIAGQLLGLTTDEIAKCMTGIEDFAEIGDYVNFPVRTYSSGMQLRLAFAVATAVRPDILIIDEALAVGDIFFQQKCFERIRSFRDQGTTLLFVSHSPGAVYALCSRAILLSDGEIVINDTPGVVIDRYNALVTSVRARSSDVRETRKELSDNDMDIPILVPGCEEQQACWRHPDIRIRSICIVQRGKISTTLINTLPAELRISVKFCAYFDDPHIGFRIHNVRGEPVFMTNTLCMNRRIGSVISGSLVTVAFGFEVNIPPGEYTLTVGVANNGIGRSDFREQLARLTHIQAFSVVAEPLAPIWAGTAHLRPSLNIVQNGFG